jgi:hypothetical protein
VRPRTLLLPLLLLSPIVSYAAETEYVSGCLKLNELTGVSCSLITEPTAAGGRAIGLALRYASVEVATKSMTATAPVKADFCISARAVGQAAAARIVESISGQEADVALRCSELLGKEEGMVPPEGGEAPRLCYELNALPGVRCFFPVKTINDAAMDMVVSFEDLNSTSEAEILTGP